MAELKCKVVVPLRFHLTSLQCNAMHRSTASGFSSLHRTATLLRLTLPFPAKLAMHIKLLAKLTVTASYACLRCVLRKQHQLANRNCWTMQRKPSDWMINQRWIELMSSPSSLIWNNENTKKTSSIRITFLQRIIAITLPRPAHSTPTH